MRQTGPQRSKTPRPKNQDHDPSPATGRHHRGIVALATDLFSFSSPSRPPRLRHKPANLAITFLGSSVRAERTEDGHFPVSGCLTATHFYTRRLVCQGKRTGGYDSNYECVPLHPRKGETTGRDTNETNKKKKTETPKRQRNLKRPTGTDAPPPEKGRGASQTARQAGQRPLKAKHRQQNDRKQKWGQRSPFLHSTTPLFWANSQTNPSGGYLTR